MKEIFDINEAIILLKDKVILKDTISNKFIYKNKRIYVYSSNSSYSLNLKDFSEIFKDSKFIVEEFEEETIDLEKDKEYYSFKHK